MAAYAVTVFIGAFLLFQVQPLIGKYLLPWFGGGPGVWSTCMLFFQLVLLAGYAYSHVLTRCFKPRRQVVLHVILLMAALACLPIVPTAKWKPQGNGNPSWAILVLLACNLGMPFFLLSSTGPLMQRWSSYWRGRTSPYRLYAFSNAASLLALITYPLLFETRFIRKAQAIWWEWGFVVYSIVCGFCALQLWRAEAPTRSNSAAGGYTAGPSVQHLPMVRIPGIALRRLLWILWPACASVLLLATTNKLCLDIAVFPFLWVLPLALYLMSFVICFDSPRWYLRGTFSLALGVSMVCLCWALFRGAAWPFWTQLIVYGGTLFICCLVCHGELFRIRPASEALTEFYLFVAAGGALGGFFVSLIAPAVFSSYYELHWGMALCGLLVAIVWTLEAGGISLTQEAIQRASVGQASAAGASWGPQDCRRLGLALLWLGFLGLAATLWLQARQPGPAVVLKSRNFYGALTVLERRKDEPKGRHVLLQHGRITHGFQFDDPQLRSWPTTYYGADSGVGLALNALPAGARRIGVIGLGTGTMAAYARPGDFFQFFEINPQVINLAASRFTFLSSCRGTWEAVPGDARLSLERAAPQAFDLLTVDAFSSDSIPVHLLTKEAFEIYLRHLKSTGILAIHTSNHFLNLEPVVLRLAREFHLEAAVIDHDANPEQWWIYSSTWILLTRGDQVLGLPGIVAAAKNGQTPKEPGLLWTDDFSSVFQVLR